MLTPKVTVVRDRVHILPLETVLNFWSYEGCSPAKHWIPLKRDDSWYEALKAKILAEGFQSGIHVTYDPSWGDSGYIHDGHHRLLICVDLGLYWCPVEYRDDIRYEDPEEWSASDYGWMGYQGEEL
jgi:hypothetical protein